MNVPVLMSKQAEELLEDLAESLQVPPSRYEAAERSYRSVGDWLHREASSLRLAGPQVYVQGSFRLGTAIRPFAEDEDYDIDLVCELSVSKSHLSQAQLKAALGEEIVAYADAHGMQPPTEGRRCWTLAYADGAQFHLDTLPAIPDGPRQRLLLENRGYSSQWSETAIAITDQDHYAYREIADDWPHSNPKGFCNWFRSRMAVIFEARRRALALEDRASVEDIPEYKVRTPLQSAIQILKHHRDRMFVGRGDEKPISIILTTLSARAYQQEPTISSALFSILRGMANLIEYRNGVAWIENPTDPAENFADRWQSHPERREAFYDWLNQAQTDFTNAATAATRDAATAALEPRLGRQLMEAANARRAGGNANGLLGRIMGGARAVGRVLSPSHKQVAPWNILEQGSVVIERATLQRNGFRPEEFVSDGSSLPKHCSLRFEAETNVPKPYKVYWQVVNTGQEAANANGLRGGFDEGIVSVGKLTRDESTSYSGTHSIECFIVKSGLLAAKSGQFIVNIQ
ncbi:MAG: nucleotidyltransferase [Rhizobiales bacterium]|nr:nucleotidyltransferase [Hyphomicrobiales bacterium]